MPEFVSKINQINAVQFTGDNESEIYAFAGEGITIYNPNEPNVEIKVHTRNGTVNLELNHWLIEGPFDFYPCDPDTFEKRWAEKNLNFVIDAATLENDSEPEVWAAEFVRAATERPDLPVNEDAMTAWFKNYHNTIIGIRDREFNRENRRLPENGS